MSECNCKQTFRTAEDYRDHLPCDFGEQGRIKELEDEVRNLTAEKSSLERTVERLENEIDQLHDDIHSDQYQGW